MHEVLEPADAATRVTDYLDVALGARRHAVVFARRTRSLPQEPRHEDFVGGRIVRLEGPDRPASGKMSSFVCRHRQFCR